MSNIPPPTSNNSHQISGGEIVIPPRPGASCGSYAALSQLLEACGPNKNDRAITLISACIGDGVNTEREIIGMGKRLGLNPKHVAVILKQDAGNNPALHRWHRGESGIYRLLGEA